jgi:hypothetical protein
MVGVMVKANGELRGSSMANQNGALAEGARRVWRYQRVLWWMFLVNLTLALFSAIPLSSRIGRITDQSLYSHRLSHSFDVFALIELASNPGVSFSSASAGSFLYSCIFFVFALFLTGGILEAYFANRKLPAAQFFEACGSFFWRAVRLLIVMLIVLVPIGFLASGVVNWSSKLANDAAPEKLGFWVEVAGMLLVLFLCMTLRLWFDMTQVRMVAENERAVRRSLRLGFRQTFGNFGSLFWLYFRISFLAWAALAIALWLWAEMSPASSRLSFIILEVLLFWWMGTRLWQRAAETVWYERHSLAETLATAQMPAAPEMVRVASPS